MKKPFGPPSRWLIFKGRESGRWRIISPVKGAGPSLWSFPDFESARAAFATGDKP